MATLKVKNEKGKWETIYGEQILSKLRKTKNLADLSDRQEARINLGLDGDVSNFNYCKWNTFLQKGAKWNKLFGVSEDDKSSWGEIGKYGTWRSALKKHGVLIEYVPADVTTHNHDDRYIPPINKEKLERQKNDAAFLNKINEQKQEWIQGVEQYSSEAQQNLQEVETQIKNEHQTRQEEIDRVAEELTELIDKKAQEVLDKILNTEIITRGSDVPITYFDSSGVTVHHTHHETATHNCGAWGTVRYHTNEVHYYTTHKKRDTLIPRINSSIDEETVGTKGTADKQLGKVKKLIDVLVEVAKNTHYHSLGSSASDKNCLSQCSTRPW